MDPLTKQIKTIVDQVVRAELRRIAKTPIYQNGSYINIAGLLNEAAHDALDHAGLTGVPSIAGLLDETAHDALAHTGLTGVATDFVDLGDVPTSYASAGSKILAVKADASGLEFVAAPAAENGVPVGGTTNQLAAKNSNADYDIKWVDAPSAVNGLPAGGAAGQVLAKVDAHDYDCVWVPGAARLVSSNVVSGSAVTSIDVTGLDINTDGTYDIEFEIVNAGSTAFTLYLFFNGGTTAAGYYSQYNCNGSGGRLNTPACGYVKASDRLLGFGKLQILGGYVTLYTCTIRGMGAAVDNETYAMSKVATVTNLTQITLTASLASGIGVGSKFRVYKGNA